MKWIGQHIFDLKSKFRNDVDITGDIIITGDVGIGTTSPTAALHVYGTTGIISESPSNASITIRRNDNTNYSALLKYHTGNSEKWVAGLSDAGDFTGSTGVEYFIGTSKTAPKFLINSSGNVGIGTASPSEKLHVVGNARIQGDLTVSGTYTQIDTDVTTTEQWLVTNDGTGPAAIINQKGSQDIFDVQDDGTSVFYIEDGGNVGIGTTSPSQKLDVVGDVKVHNTGSGNNATLFIDTVSGGNADSILNFREATVDRASLYWDGGDNDLYLTTTTGDFLINPSGNVGIGTTSPSEKLHIVGDLKIATNADAGVIHFGDTSDETKIVGYDSSDSNTRFDFFTSGAKRLTILDSGNVGIGTASPSKELHIKSSAPRVLIEGTGASAEDAEISRISGLWDGTYVADIQFLAGDDTSNKDNGKIAFRTYTSDGAVGTRMLIEEAGNVGIGTTSPLANLHVESKILISQDLGDKPKLAFSENVSNDDEFIIEYQGDGAGSGNYVSFYSDISGWSDLGEGFNYIPENGRVGIGTTSPEEKLSVSGSIQLTNQQDLTWADIGDGNAGRVAIRGNEDADWIMFKTDNSERMRLTSTGLGIGTTSPGQKLEVDEGYINVTGAGTSHGYELERDGLDTYRFRHLDGGLTIYNNTDARKEMTFDGAGNVGIGTSSPASLLHVAGTVQGETIKAHHADGNGVSLHIGRIDNSNYWNVNHAGNDFRLYNTAGSGSDILLGVDASGNVEANNVGIGTASPASKLHVAGTVQVGVDDTGYDVRFYGATSGKYMHWDESQDRLEFTDTTEVVWGTDGDLNIVHNGTDGKITEKTGHLYIRTQADDKDVILQSDDGSGGTTAYLTLDGSAECTTVQKKINFEDSIIASFGAGGDFYISHNGSYTSLMEQTSDLYISNSADDKDIIFRCDDGSGGLTAYLTLDGSVGYVKFNKDAVFVDDEKAKFGTGLDLEIYHDGSNSYINQRNTGDLIIQNATDDKDIIFKSDDGSGGLTAYLTLDGSASTVNLFSTLTVGTGSATMSGILDVTNTSNSYATGTSNTGVVDGDTGAIRTEGGISVAKKGYFGGQLWAKGMTTTTPGLEIRPGTTGNSGYLPAIIYRDNDTGSANYLLIDGTTTAFAAYDSATGGVTQDLSKMVRIKTADSSELEVHIGDSGSTSAELTVKGFNVGLCTSWILNDSVSGVAVSGSDKIYTITHGMGSSRNYGVQVIRNAANSGNGETVYTDVTRTDTTIVVTFASAPTAGDYTALVTKFPE